MTALAANRARSIERWDQHTFTLASGSVGYKGGAVVISPGTGKVIPATTGPGLQVIGVFAEKVDASSADKTVNVQLNSPIEVEWQVNSGTNAIASTDLGATAYQEDDQTVGIKAYGYSAAGRIMAVDSVRGVAVQRFGAGKGTVEGVVSVLAATQAYTSNDLALGSNPNSGTMFDVPTTAANSTISLPATAKEGTVLWFAADGTKNGHTVQYRDVATAITTALTASKRHLVECRYTGGKWFANAYVSP